MTDDNLPFKISDGVKATGGQKKQSPWPQICFQPKEHSRRP